MNQKTAQKRIQEAIDSVASARAEWPEIQAMVESVRNDGRLSESYRAERLRETVGTWREHVVGGLQRRTAGLYAEREKAEERLAELREVSPEVMAARASVLAPVLQNAHTDPGILLGAYRARFGDLADRQILEESAELVQTAFTGPNYPQNNGFGERWQRLQGEMVPYLPEAEQEVISAGESFAETAGYLEAATRMFDVDLAELSGEGPNTQSMMQREYDRVAVHRFENAAQESAQEASQSAEASAGTAA